MDMLHGQQLSQKILEKMRRGAARGATKPSEMTPRIPSATLVFT